jgi:hypothetical protein
MQAYKGKTGNWGLETLREYLSAKIVELEKKIDAIAAAVSSNK